MVDSDNDDKKPGENDFNFGGNDKYTSKNNGVDSGRNDRPSSSNNSERKDTTPAKMWESSSSNSMNRSTLDVNNDDDDEFGLLELLEWFFTGKYKVYKLGITGLIIVIIISFQIYKASILPRSEIIYAQESLKYIENVEAYVKESKDRYDSIMGGEDGAFLNSYVDSEGWENTFQVASKKLSKAESDYQEIIVPIIEKNSSQDLDKLKKSVHNVRYLGGEVEEKIKMVFTSIYAIKKERNEFDTNYNNMEQRYKNIEKNMAELKLFVNDSIKTFPKQKENISEMYTQCEHLMSSLSKHFNIVINLAELRREGGFVDYRDVSKVFKNISELSSTLEQNVNVTTTKLEQLSISYSIILLDMKTEPFLVVGYSIWDNDSDFDFDSSGVYQPIKVDFEFYDYMVENFGNGALIASIKNNQIKEMVSPNYRYKLSIDFGSALHYPKDSGEFWLDSWEEKYYQKRLYIVDGKEQQTVWQEVNEATFNMYKDALGMTIISKPYGKFEDEANKRPVPLGMDFVGNPRYGEWRTNSTGSYWHFFRQYSLYKTLGGGRYSRRDYDYYDTWYRGSYTSGYYGPDINSPVYGTYGSKTRSSSTWANSQYVKSDEIKRADASVRGAGKSNRARGAGGGGK